jgi:putative MATE family efflux protein
MTTTPHLTDGPIGATLIRLAAPMLVGILAMMAFNVIDTYFVGQLGTVALAAMTMTFPVVMVIGTFTLGLGVGAMAVISKGIGAGDQSGIRRCTTDALSLSVVCVVVMCAIGLATMEPLFRLLGATEAMLPLIEQYMIIWYPGMLVYVVPMIGNNIIRATGDTTTPSVVMIAGVLLNTVLDPLLIFGWGPVPAYGIAGAAIATVVARAFTLAVALWVLARRERLLATPWPGLTELLASWKKILTIGLPVAVSNAVIPIAMGVITRIVAQFGEATVAGFGVATRIEGLALALVFAVSTGISPFVGQNFGAGRFDRIRAGLTFANRFCLLWGGLVFIAFLLFGEWMATAFDPDPEVIRSASGYLWIVAISLGLRSVHTIAWTALNVLSRPYDAMVLEFLLAFVLWIPFSLVGGYYGQITGVYIGLSLANVLAGIAAYLWMGRVTGRLAESKK